MKEIFENHQLEIVDIKKRKTKKFSVLFQASKEIDNDLKEYIYCVGVRVMRNDDKPMTKRDVELCRPGISKIISELR